MLPAMHDKISLKSDPRQWFALLLGTYVVCGLTFLGFGRDHDCGEIIG